MNKYLKCLETISISFVRSMVLTSIDPKIWGPSAWSLLHAISFHSESSYEDLKDLYGNLMHILPCEKCRESYRNHLTVLPFPEKSNSIPKWLYLLHNRVSSTLDVKDNDHPSYRKITQLWNKNKEDAIHMARENGWKFLFLLVKVFPSKKVERYSSFLSSLGIFMNEVCTTIFKKDVTCSTDSFKSRKSYRQWLENTYKTLECCDNIPSHLIKVPSRVCTTVCAIR